MVDRAGAGGGERRGLGEKGEGIGEVQVSSYKTATGM